MTEDCITKMYNNIANKKTDYIASSYNEINENSSTNGNTKILEPITITSNKSLIEYIFADYSLHCTETAWNKLFKTSFLRKNNILFIPNIYYEDVLFNIKVFTLAKSYCAIPDITYLYRHRNDSITHQLTIGFKAKQIKDRAYTFKQVKIYLKKFIKYENYEIAEYQNSVRCYYFAKAYYSHNYNRLKIKSYIKDFLYNPLSFSQILKLKKYTTKIVLLWLLGKCPYFIIKLFL